MTLINETRSTRGEAGSIVIVSIINSTRKNQGMNPWLRGDRLAKNDSCFTAFLSFFRKIRASIMYRTQQNLYELCNWKNVVAQTKNRDEKQLTNELYFSCFEILYWDCREQVLPHNVSMGCRHSALRHSSQPPAGSELNNEKTECVLWRSNLSSPENEACLVITSLKILLLKILSESRKQWLVLVNGAHSKGVAMGTICWSRARVTRGGGDGGGGWGANNYAVRVAKITCLYF